MMSTFRLAFRRTIAAVALFTAASCLISGPAQARVFIGFGFPFFGPGYYPPPPVYYPPPPVYYAPPTVYAPPPTVYAQPRAYSQAPASGAGQACYAGPYVCPMDHPTATGSNCYCLGNGGSRVWGRAN